MTNFQTKNPRSLPVDVALVKSLLVRLMTSADQGLDRINKQHILMKNMETLGMSPEAHLAMVMKAMDRLQQENKPPVYETGLMLGVTLCLTARSANGRQMLRRMLSDIELQQSVDRENVVAEFKAGCIDCAQLSDLCSTHRVSATAFPDTEVTQ